MDGPGLIAGKLAALGSERPGVARLIGIEAAPALPRTHEGNFAVLADRSLAGFHSDARRAVLVEHGVAVAGNIAGDLDRDRLAPRRLGQRRFRTAERSDKSFLGLRAPGSGGRFHR